MRQLSRADLFLLDGFSGAGLMDKLINTINEALDLVHRIEAMGDTTPPMSLALESEEHRITLATLHCRLATVLAQASIESLKLVKHQ